MARGREVAFGIVLGPGLIAGLSWPAFRRMGDVREATQNSYDRCRGMHPPQARTVDIPADLASRSIARILPGS